MNDASILLIQPQHAQGTDTPCRFNLTSDHSIQSQYVKDIQPKRLEEEVHAIL